MARDKDEVERDIKITKDLIEIKDKQAKDGTTPERRSKHGEDAKELRGRLADLEAEKKKSK